MVQAQNKRVLVGTPNREPQACSRNVIGYKDPGSYIPIMLLPHSWGSLFGVPSKVPLQIKALFGVPSKVPLQIKVVLHDPQYTIILSTPKRGP